MLFRAVLAFCLFFAGSTFANLHATFPAKAVLPLNINATTLYTHRLVRLKALHLALLENEDYANLTARIEPTVGQDTALLAQFFESSLSDESINYSMAACPEGTRNQIPYCVFADALFTVNTAKQSLIVKAFLSEPSLMDGLQVAIKDYQQVIDAVLAGQAIAQDVVDVANNKLNAVRAALFNFIHLIGGGGLSGLLSLQDVLSQAVYDVNELNRILTHWADLFANTQTYASVNVLNSQVNTVREKDVEVDITFQVDIAGTFFDTISQLMESSLQQPSNGVEVDTRFNGRAFYHPKEQTLLAYVDTKVSASICYGGMSAQPKTLSTTIIKAIDMISDSNLTIEIDVEGEKTVAPLQGSEISEVTARIPYTDQTGTLRKKDIVFQCKASATFLKSVTKRISSSLSREDKSKPMSWKASFRHELGY